MVSRCSSTPKHPSQAGPISAKIDRLTLPRAYLQSGKLRGRKAMRTNPYKHPAIKDSIFATSSSTNSPTPSSTSSPNPHDPNMPFVPSIPPLVDPAHWRSLPRVLQRPTITEVKAENIASAEPAYAKFTPEEVRENFPYAQIRRVHAHLLSPARRLLTFVRLIRAIAPYNGGPRLTVSAPSAVTLPPHYDFLLTDVGVAMRPTHAFGIYPTFSAVQDDVCTPHQLPTPFPQTRSVQMLPSHGGIWAAHCSRLRAMPAMTNKLAPVSDPTPDKPGTSMVRLPLVPMPLPYPPGFLYLTRYIYSKVQWHLIAELLLPIDDSKELKAQLGPWDGLFDCVTVLPRTQKTEMYRELTPEGVDKFGAFLAERFELIDLCRLARSVWGTHQDAVYLGMVDVKLWESLEFAWASVLKAMEIVDSSMDVAGDDE